MARLLAIDSDQPFRNRISSYLEGLGYSIIQCANGTEAMNTFFRETPELVIIGLASQDNQDAFDTLRELVENHPDIPCIAISASTDVMQAVEVLRLGAWDYLPRPIPEAEVLAHSIQRALDQAILRRENQQHYTQLKTANRKLQTALEEATRARLSAEQASRVRSEFLSGISNEIRTPMNGILGMAEILLESLLSQEQEHYTRVIRESARTLMSVFNDLLDYSRIETGSLLLDRVPFSLAELFDDLNDEMRSRAFSKKLSYEFKFEGDLPDSLMGDPWRIRQVLANIVENAIKFTRRGGITIRVHPEMQTEEYVLLKFEVIDTGIGVPRELLPTLFDSFNRVGAPPDRNHTGGLGLGLALSLKLTTLMNGRMGAMSNPGDGSVFWFTVKLQRPEQPRRMSTPIFNRSIPQSESKLERLRSLRVLLAEDSHENQMVAEAYFKKLGVTHAMAGDGMKVLQLLEENDFDVVLMDLEMPGMNGLEATGVIRSPISAVRNHEIPIVAVTAFTTEEDRNRCLRAGMNAHLPKPFSFQQLVDVIDQTLNGGPKRPVL